MRVDPVRNFILISALAAAFVLAAALDARHRSTMPRAEPLDPDSCSIPEGAGPEAVRTYACTGRMPVNSATAEDLVLLPSIGPARARAIVEHRRLHGPFRSPEDLLDVTGIGSVTLERIRSRIAIDRTEVPAENDG